MITIYIFKVVYIYLIGLILAVLEIQIEGPHGWAKNLPAWQPRAGGRIQRWWFRVFKKDLTGYHLVLIIFLLLFFHIHFIWSWSWSWMAELETLAFFIFFAAFWDFLWFVLNPHHSLHDFDSKHVWWHRHWLGPMPVDYYVAVLLTIGLFIPLILQDFTYLLKLLILLVGVVIMTLITILIYPKTH